MKIDPGTRQQLAELHIHLEGAVEADLLRKIDKDLTSQQIDEIWGFQDFPAFLQSFKAIVLRLRTAEHFRWAARELFTRLAKQGIVYVEVTHSLGVSLWRKLDAKAIVEGLIEEGRLAPLEVHWILDGVRQFGGDHLLETA